MSHTFVSQGVEVMSVTLALGAIIVLLAFFAKRFNLNKFSTQRGFQVLSQQSIGPREKILLLNFSGKNLLVGIVPGAITLLSETELSHSDKKEAFSYVLKKEQVG